MKRLIEFFTFFSLGFLFLFSVFQCLNRKRWKWQSIDWKWIVCPNMWRRAEHREHGPAVRLRAIESESKTIPSINFHWTDGIFFFTMKCCVFFVSFGYKPNELEELRWNLNEARGGKINIHKLNGMKRRKINDYALEWTVFGDYRRNSRYKSSLWQRIQQTQTQSEREKIYVWEEERAGRR